MSPTISLQILETLVLFFNKLIQAVASFIFFELIAWKGASSAVNAATPIISNNIPIPITMRIITIKTMTLMSDNKDDSPLNIADKMNEIINTWIIHLSFNEIFTLSSKVLFKITYGISQINFTA